MWIESETETETIEVKTKSQIEIGQFAFRSETLIYKCTYIRTMKEWSVLHDVWHFVRKGESKELGEGGQGGEGSREGRRRGGGGGAVEEREEGGKGEREEEEVEVIVDKVFVSEGKFVSEILPRFPGPWTLDSTIGK